MKCDILNPVKIMSNEIQSEKGLFVIPITSHISWKRVLNFKNVQQVYHNWAE